MLDKTVDATPSSSSLGAGGNRFFDLPINARIRLGLGRSGIDVVPISARFLVWLMPEIQTGETLARTIAFAIVDRSRTALEALLRDVGMPVLRCCSNETRRPT